MIYVLVNDDCSPNDFVHDEESYPAFYDFCHSLASVYESTSMQHSNPSWFLYCCIRSQSTVIAAHLCEAYGDQVTRAICTPPSLDSCLTDDALVSEHSIMFVFPWLCYPLDELTCMLHCLSCDDILSCIHLQPHMKSCNSLANALWQCALQLCHGGPRMVVDVAMALLPFLDIHN
jgi:hypothetical protein